MQLSLSVNHEMCLFPQDTLFHVFEEDATLTEKDAHVREMRANPVWSSLLRQDPESIISHEMLRREEHEKTERMKPKGISPQEFTDMFVGLKGDFEEGGFDTHALYTTKTPYDYEKASCGPSGLSGASSVPLKRTRSGELFGPLHLGPHEKLEMPDKMSNPSFSAHLLTRPGVDVPYPPPTCVPVASPAPDDTPAGTDRQRSPNVPNVVDTNGENIEPPVFNGKIDFHVQIRAANDLVRIATSRGVGNIVALHVVTGRGNKYRGLYGGKPAKYKFNMAWTTYTVAGMKVLQKAFQLNMIERNHFDCALSNFLMRSWKEVHEDQRNDLIAAKNMHDMAGETAEDSFFVQEAIKPTGNWKECTVGDMIGSCLTVPTIGDVCNHVSSTSPNDGLNTQSSWDPAYVAEDLTSARIQFALWCPLVIEKKKSGKEKTIKGWVSYLNSHHVSFAIAKLVCTSWKCCATCVLPCD